MRKTEVILSIIAAAACLGITLWLWGSLSAVQSLWPFPALYLLELIAISAIALYSSLRDVQAAGIIIWSVVGLFLAFVILASFTIGLFYYPVVILFTIVAILSDLRHKRKLLPHLGIFLLAAILQTGLIFFILQLIKF